jgi:hypothetical protein
VDGRHARRSLGTRQGVARLSSLVFYFLQDLPHKSLYKRH